IQNDDTAPPAAKVTINDVAVAEGNAGSSDATFTVTAAGTHGTITFQWRTGDDSALGGSDYTPASGSGTIAADKNSTRLTVKVLGDTVDENDESFKLVVDNIVGADPGAKTTGVATITNDDNNSVVSIGDTSVDEGGTA